METEMTAKLKSIRKDNSAVGKSVLSLLQHRLKTEPSPYLVCGHHSFIYVKEIVIRFLLYIVGF